MDRAEAEAIYDSGRQRCVEFIRELAASVEQLTAAGELLEERVRRLETEALAARVVGDGGASDRVLPWWPRTMSIVWSTRCRLLSTDESL